MSDNLLHPHRRQLRRDVGWCRYPGTGRLLGGVVRPVQDDRPDPRADRRRARRASSPIAKLNIDDNLADAGALRRDEHPDADPVQGRRADRSPRRRQGQGSAARGARPIPVGPSRLYPLQLGDTGPAVADLQRRLLAQGLPSPARTASSAPRPKHAVRAFQERRGLVVDGICGRQTWSSLVEAGYRLGDRLLYLRTPYLRGDDVADLQRRLGALGFDAGRIDGILGPDGDRALRSFQRNAGLSVDGICGTTTVRALQPPTFQRARTRCRGGAGVGEVGLGASRRSVERQVAIGEYGGARRLRCAKSRLRCATRVRS